MIWTMEQVINVAKMRYSQMYPEDGSLGSANYFKELIHEHFNRAAKMNYHVDHIDFRDLIWEREIRADRFSNYRVYWWPETQECNLNGAVLTVPWDSQTLINRHIYTPMQISPRFTWDGYAHYSSPVAQDIWHCLGWNNHAGVWEFTK